MGIEMIMTEKQEAYLRKQVDKYLDALENIFEDNPIACDRIQAVRDALENLDGWID